MKSNFAVLINQYRAVFGEDDLPFLCVQLARYSSGNLYAPIVRQAQLDVLDSAAVNTTEHLAMTVSIDTDKGTSKVIHPLGKRHSRRAYGDTMVGDDRFKGVE